LFIMASSKAILSLYLSVWAQNKSFPWLDNNWLVLQDSRLVLIFYEATDDIINDSCLPVEHKRAGVHYLVNGKIAHRISQEKNRTSWLSG
jgi:hypothetical protein